MSSFALLVLSWALFAPPAASGCRWRSNILFQRDRAPLRLCVAPGRRCFAEPADGPSAPLQLPLTLSAEAGAGFAVLEVDHQGMTLKGKVSLRDPLLFPRTAFALHGYFRPDALMIAAVGRGTVVVQASPGPGVEPAAAPRTTLDCKQLSLEAPNVADDILAAHGPTHPMSLRPGRAPLSILPGGAAIAWLVSTRARPRAVAAHDGAEGFTWIATEANHGVVFGWVPTDALTEPPRSTNAQEQSLGATGCNCGSASVPDSSPGLECARPVPVFAAVGGAIAEVGTVLAGVRISDRGHFGPGFDRIALRPRLHDEPAYEFRAAGDVARLRLRDPLPARRAHRMLRILAGATLLAKRQDLASCVATDARRTDR